VASTKRGKGDKQIEVELSPARPVKGQSKMEVSPIKKSVSS
jgi:hypothetical protein